MQKQKKKYKKYLYCTVINPIITINYIDNTDYDKNAKEC